MVPNTVPHFLCHHICALDLHVCKYSISDLINDQIFLQYKQINAVINIWYLDVTGFGILNLGYLTSYINILAVDQPDETQSLPVAVIAGATAAAVVIAVVAVLAAVVLRRLFFQ